MKLERRTFILAGSGALVTQAAPSDNIVMGVIGSGQPRHFRDERVSERSRRSRSAPSATFTSRTWSGRSRRRPRPARIRRLTELQGAACRQERSGRADRDTRALAPSHGARCAGRRQGCLRGEAALPDAGSRASSWWRRRRNRRASFRWACSAAATICIWTRRKMVAAGTLGNVRMVRSWWLNNYLEGAEGHQARRPARLGAVAGTGAQARASIRIASGNWRLYSDYSGGMSPTRARMSSTAFTC